jgi:RHS repeat-associated protein
LRVIFVKYLNYLFLFFLVQICFAEEFDDISQLEISLSADSEPLATVAQCVNVNSGQFFQVDSDLVTHTIDPLSLLRYYDNGSKKESFMGRSFGSQFPIFASDAQSTNRHSYAMICERETFLIPYRSSSERLTHTEGFLGLAISYITTHSPNFKIDPRVLQKGYTNATRDHISGRSNLTNWEGKCFTSEQEPPWVIKTGDGTIRYYGIMKVLQNMQRKELDLPTKRIYLLTKEIKPNGNQLYFDYTSIDDKPRLSSIKTVNRKGNVINELNIEYSKEQCVVKSSCGSRIRYLQKAGRFNPHEKRLEQVESSQNGLTTYRSVSNHGLVSMTEIHKPKTSLKIEYNKDDQVISETDENGFTTEYSYTASGEVTQIKYPDQAQESFTYYPNGLLKKHTQADGVMISYEYDPVGQLTKKTPQGPELSKSESYVYKGTHLIKKYNALGVLTTYSYDGMGRKISEKVGSKVTNYDYDEFDRLTKIIRILDDQTSQQEIFEYDWLDRVTSKTLQDNQSRVYAKESYEYDVQGNRINKSVLQAQDQLASYRSEYDFHDNPIKIQDPIHNITQKRKYNIHNHLIKEDLSNVKLQFDYDALERLVKVLLPDNSFIQYNYDAFNIKEVQRYNKKSQPLYNHTLEYNLRRQLTKINSPVGEVNHVQNLLGSVTNIHTTSWECHLAEFDDNHNLLTQEIKDPLGTTTNHYQYDFFNHVTQEKGHHENAYTYDSLGNCLKHNEQTHQINHLNQITNNGTHLLYDLNGNLISAPPTTYKYDALDRLLSFTENNVTTSFIYDAFNRCISIRDSTGVKNLFYQGNQEIGSLKENKLHELRIVHPSQEQTYAIEIQNKAYFPLQDSTNNIVALKNERGTILQGSRYSAFGTKETFGDKIENPWTFANRREIGHLTMFQHRFYHPKLMRWLTPDRFKDGLNLYNYVRNNPFRYIDPDGRFAIVIPLFTIGFGIEFTFATVTVATVAASATYAVAQWACGEIDRAVNRDTRSSGGSRGQTNQQESEEQEENKKQEDNKKFRTEPASLEEKLALDEAKAGAGDKIEDLKIKDPKYKGGDW